MRTDDPRAEAYVTAIFGSLATDRSDDIGEIETFDILAAETPIRLLHNGRVLTTGDDLDACLTFLHWRLNQVVIDTAADTHVLLHASAVRRDRRGGRVPRRVELRQVDAGRRAGARPGSAT